MSNDESTRADEYYAGLGEYEVAALWKQLATLLPPEPTSPAQPYIWRYDQIRPLLMEAGEVVTAEEAERRVLMLINPGLAPKAAAVTNVYAGIQLVQPGEVAPAHRHAAAALRFVIEGSGGYTAVNGERAFMHPGDLVLTPSWTWHDHGNETADPMIWLDGLDLPLINDLDANFFGGALEQSQTETKPADYSANAYGGGKLAPRWEEDEWSERYSPLVRYPWDETRAALINAASVTAGSAADGVILEYTNPLSGGPVMPTLAAYVQLMRAGAETTAHQHTTNTVYHVKEGNGTSIVGGERIEWGPRDTFAVPGWAVHEHIVGDQDAILFSMSDEPVMRSLGFLRQQEAGSQR